MEAAEIAIQIGDDDAVSKGIFMWKIRASQYLVDHRHVRVTMHNLRFDVATTQEQTSIALRSADSVRAMSAKVDR
jgi:hypothetical protein